MNKKTRGYIELISYACAALFSVSLFVFGTLFPKYMFADEGFGTGMGDTKEERSISVEDVRMMLCGQHGEWESAFEDVKVTSLTYECLKEIVDGWD